MVQEHHTQRIQIRIQNMFCACCESGQEVEEFKEVTTLPILVPQPETREAGPPKQTPKAPSFGSFMVMIPMKGYSSFGVQLDVTDKKAGPMITEIQSGAIAGFNAQHPEQALEPWDTIAELEDAQNMVEVYEKMNGPLPDTVRMVVKRPRRLQLTLSKSDGPLGLLLDYKPSSVGGVIAEVRDLGLVSKWNRDHPADAIGKGDRILEINGSMPIGEAIIEEIKRANDLELMVLKFAS